MKHIQTVTATGSTSIIDFSMIPQTFTHLMLLVSPRHPTATVNSEHYVTINGIGGNFPATSMQFLRGNGAGGITPYQLNGVGALFQLNFQSAANTANTFGAVSIFMPNYSQVGVAKNFFIQSVAETNAGEIFQILAIANISNTSATTSIQYAVGGDGGNWIAGTTASLYGITG